MKTPTVKRVRRKAKRKPRDMSHAPIGSYDERQVTGEGPYKRKIHKKVKEAVGVLKKSVYKRMEDPLLAQSAIDKTGYETTGEAGLHYKCDPYDPPALDITIDTGKPIDSPNKLKEDKSDKFLANIQQVILLALLFCVGALTENLLYETPKPKIIYRNPQQTYDLKANPFESGKIPLTAGQIEIY